MDIDLSQHVRFQESVIITEGGSAGGKGAEGRLGGRRWQGTGKATGGGGKKGGTPVVPKDRTDKGDSLMEDTPRDAVTNALRFHLHNFAYKTFKIKAAKCMQMQF